MLQQNDIIIAPIFDQAAPGVWEDFVELRASRLENTSTPYTDDMRKDAFQEYQTMWRRNKNNFAFGAYDGDKMVGFAQGLFQSKGGDLNSLFVLPEYQRNRIGTRLLSRAEDVSRLVAKRILVRSVPSSVPFYSKRGFCRHLAPHSYEMTKQLPRGPRSVCVIPVFRSVPTITRACSAICADYDPNRVNDLHNPTFVFVDSVGEILGYIDDTGPHVKRTGLNKLITNCLNRTYNEFLTVNNLGR